MNKNNLKSYAPQARKDFIAAVTARAQQLGMTATHTQPVSVSGDVALIDGVEWPAKVAAQREKLVQRIRRHGFGQTMEEVAYTWFNRFAALRYMELHDFLDHGHRALSSRDGGLPELLRHAAEVSLPGLNPAKVQEMQLAGNRDDELYKQLLVAQCNALSAAMPFLFERIDDDTELLLPDNLLRTDSIVAKLVAGVPEQDWQEIEVIGWLYQFYISEKKDQVIGKVVKSEDIPAATQLFTPNWIVQYLVQNSVGRLWLMANPSSQLASEWPYYIQPAEQTPEVQAQLDALIHTRIAEDGDTLNPETITVLDPACGSGHILVVAYDVLKAIYLERGYRLRDIPRLILEKNLYGLDIDDRAAQMAGFALLMKARADDRRLLGDPENPPKLNVLSLQESTGLDAQALHASLTAGHSPQASPRAPDAGFADTDLFPATRPQMTLGEAAALPAPGASTGLTQQAIAELLATFAHAKTFGSLIQIGPQRLPSLREQLSILKNAQASGDLYAQAAAKDLLPLVRQALVLGMQFDAVVANPPYMGINGMNALLKSFMSENYPNAKSDVYAGFISSSFSMAKRTGFISGVTIQGWLFLSSFQSLRDQLINEKTITSLVQIGFNSFPSLNSKIAMAAMFSCNNEVVINHNSTFFDLNQGSVSEDKNRLFLSILPNSGFVVSPSDFNLLPGKVFAYWLPPPARRLFAENDLLGKFIESREGLTTANNEKFLRFHYEVSNEYVDWNCKSENDLKRSTKKWFPYLKGGGFRKWAGNFEYLLDWAEDGRAVKSNIDPISGRIRSHNYNGEYSFRSGISWTLIGIDVGARLVDDGFMFDANAGMAFSMDEKTKFLALGLINSSLGKVLLKALSPSLAFKHGHILGLPFIKSEELYYEIELSVKKLNEISLWDWNSSERSWCFLENPLVSGVRSSGDLRLCASYDSYIDICRANTATSKEKEEYINSRYLNAYGLNGTFSFSVPIEQITLNCNPSFRYGSEISENEKWIRYREETTVELISYAIGCMMGRYSLDAPGLIYAHAGNVGFDPSRYPSFPADADGILPVTDQPWFTDDAAARVREFLHAVWGPDTLEENLAWLAESLVPKGSETPEETIRRYIADKFFKDHLQTYKKRPIYWLFSSGKQGAFQALVYLHRYHEGTLARMRAEYVIPLSAKMAARLEMLEQDANAATSAAARTKVRKQIESLRKKQTELLAFDEKLRHYADMRITLDLDDGVKVNYGKFGDLLEGVKVVTGGKEED